MNNNYKELNIQKSLYRGCGESFAERLEKMDPTENYRGTELGHLDAFQRQLKRFDIQVGGSHSSALEKFFQNGQSAVLFPEYLMRAIRQGMEENDPLSSIVAARTLISATDYRGLTTNDDLEADVTNEAAALSTTTISLKDKTTALKKRGRMLRASYEAIKFQRLDLFTLALRRIGAEIARCQMKDAVDVLVNGDGSTGSAPQKLTTAATTLAYSDLLTLWSKFTAYQMNTLLVNTKTAAAILGLSAFSDPTTGLHFQNTGKLGTPLGAEMILCDAVADGTIIALDRRYALEMVVGDAVTVDADRLIDCQLERAAVSSTAEGLDTGISGIQLFIKAIPYNLYSLLTFVFIIALSVMRFDYGPMKGFEQKAQKTGDLSALENSENESGSPKGKVIDLLIPVLVLIVVCTIGMIYVGGFFGTDAWGGTGCAGDFIGAFGNTDAFIGLPWGGIIALLFTVIYLVARRVVTFKEAMACVPKGFNAMISPILILTLAVSLKATITSLGASVYVHDLMEGAAAALYAMLPAVIFAVACVLAFASGTSWGTFGILIPIVTAIFPASSELLIIGISACCAGAVMGDHCSPISDTTIMASAGAQCNHLDHVATQLPYVLTVASVCVVGFIVAGFVQNVYITWVVCFVLLMGVLFVIRSLTRKKI